MNDSNCSLHIIPSALASLNERINAERNEEIVKTFIFGEQRSDDSSGKIFGCKMLHCYALNMILLILNGNESENDRKVVRTEQTVLRLPRHAKVWILIDEIWIQKFLFNTSF